MRFISYTLLTGEMINSLFLKQGCLMEIKKANQMKRFSFFFHRNVTFVRTILLFCYNVQEDKVRQTKHLYFLFLRFR